MLHTLALLQYTKAIFQIYLAYRVCQSTNMGINFVTLAPVYLAKYLVLTLKMRLTLHLFIENNSCYLKVHCRSIFLVLDMHQYNSMNQIIFNKC